MYTQLMSLPFPFIKLIQISNISANCSFAKLSVLIVTNSDAMNRIVDNIINNACKYNKKNGSVWISIHPQNHTLHIEDNGKGIESPEKVFNRFYKEHERGLGIGLHIVKKLRMTEHPASKNGEHPTTFRRVFSVK